MARAISTRWRASNRDVYERQDQQKVEDHGKGHPKGIRCPSVPDPAWDAIPSTLTEAEEYYRNSPFIPSRYPMPALQQVFCVNGTVLWKNASSSQEKSTCSLR